ncbi:hypothetical protein [Spirosoma fluviale]|uniref:Uncharacterized protein n=1 Tax=Spirosoma fluviale TaxID=1597977 RepID=A0A286F8C5_9BACT|nr:hypothetical protein [Spirosoma fluviale]SOD79450.1 hypothetical protein SAMN06269250_0963 [Spirosoma fluviale]
MKTISKGHMAFTHGGTDGVKDAGAAFCATVMGGTAALGLMGALTGGFGAAMLGIAIGVCFYGDSKGKFQ